MIPIRFSGEQNPLVLTKTLLVSRFFVGSIFVFTNFPPFTTLPLAITLYVFLMDGRVTKGVRNQLKSKFLTKTIRIVTKNKLN